MHHIFLDLFSVDHAAIDMMAIFHTLKGNFPDNNTFFEIK